MTTRRPAALLISAYHAVSHAHWSATLMARLDAFAWRQIELPARHFSWRVRGSALSLLDRRYHEYFAPPPQVVVATSMFDLATARACIAALRNTHCLVYFHENQFAYPSDDPGLIDIQLLSIKTALAADRVLFNSAYNRATFFSGAAALLARMPDGVPSDLLDGPRARSTVLPVPVAASPSRVGRRARQAGGSAAPLRIVWNHRWEHDKGPERLLLALRILRAAGAHFELHLCGQQFRQQPACFEALQSEFGAASGTCGFIAERSVYLDLLTTMDIVVSTALHEFQGLAVLEAMMAGCIPLVPDRLAYPEYIPPRCRYASCPDDAGREAAELARHLAVLVEQKRTGALPPVPACEQFYWTHVEAAWRSELVRPGAC